MNVSRLLILATRMGGFAIAAASADPLSILNPNIRKQSNPKPMKNPKTAIPRFVIAGAILFAACSAHAATIAGVTIEDFSSERGGFSRYAVNTINGSGFNESAGTHDNANNTGWQSNGAGEATPDITFDLGAVYTVDSFSVWNYNHNGQTQNGIHDVTITYGETLALGSTLTEVTSFSEADGTATYTGETFNFSTPITARYIKFDATSNYGDPDRAGLAEVRFSAVPEPSAFGMLGGVFLLMFVRRRR